MALSWFDIGVFILFVASVVGFSISKSRREETSEDYFLAGRGVTWWLIGFSLIAANISTEQFVGMSGSGAGNVGLAIASYEWCAAVTLVFVAIFFLPRFLSSGIYTIPEFLEYRYNAAARAIMAMSTMVIYITVTITAVIYSGGLTIYKIFDINLVSSIWIIGIIAAFYTSFGGLKAVVWADLIQGSALIVGGALVMFLGFKAIGGIAPFMEANADRMHMSLPADHNELPWTALLFGIWIPNFYYWGLNQYITQRTLAAHSLKQGQLGVIFAAFLKLVIPFIIVVPGIMALQLYGPELRETADAAYPVLIRNLVPGGLRGFMLAAITGAVMSSLASMLNSASTIFTMDLYKRHIKKDASNKTLIFIGRLMTIVFVVIGCLIAPQLANPKFKGVFHFIQDFQGFISPGILAAFVFGIAVKRAPAAAAITAMLLNVPVYGLLHLPAFEHMAFLNKMAITFAVLIVAMTIVTILKPLKEPKVMPTRKDIDMTPAPSVIWLGGLVIAITISLYVIFW